MYVIVRSGADSAMTPALRSFGVATSSNDGDCSPALAPGASVGLRPRNDGRNNMSYEFILTETRGRVGLITLNRPQVLNALNRQLVRELMDALEAFDHDEGIGAMVVMSEEHTSELQSPTKIV